MIIRNIMIHANLARFPGMKNIRDGNRNGQDTFTRGPVYSLRGKNDPSGGFFEVGQVGNRRNFQSSIDTTKVGMKGLIKEVLAKENGSKWLETSAVGELLVYRDTKEILLGF